jgi:CBS domain-containing protein
MSATSRKTSGHRDGSTRDDDWLRHDQERRAWSEWSQHVEAGISTLLVAPVSEAMRREPPCVPATLSEVVLEEWLVGRGLEEALVVDAIGRLRGVVAAGDILRARTDAPELPRVEHGGDRLGPGVHDEWAPRTAGELAHHLPVSLTEGESIARALSRMARHGLDWAPVVDEDGKLIGLLHAVDALRWLMHRRGVPEDWH